MGQKRILIVGSSGMIGKIILREALDTDEVSEVITLVRKPSGHNHPKLKEVLHTDFENYEAVIEYFKNVDVAHFCIGVYTGQVSDAEFRRITVDMAKIFGDTVKEHSPKATFCLLSGSGADQSEKSRVAFARYKGMAENYLIRKGFDELYIFRPAYIYPVEKRNEPNLMYRISRSLYPLLKKLFPSSAITSERLAKAMFKAGLQGAQKSILENEDIKQV